MVLRCRKIFLLIKVFNELQKTKNQEKSTHWKNYFVNHLVKFLQDKTKPWGVGAFRVKAGYYFLKKKLLVKVLQLNLTHCANSIHFNSIHEAYCNNVFVNMKLIWRSTIYLKLISFVKVFCVSHFVCLFAIIKENNDLFYEENNHWNWIQRGLSLKKSIDGYVFLKSMLKWLKYTWWSLM